MRNKKTGQGDRKLHIVRREVDWRAKRRYGFQLVAAVAVRIRQKNDDGFWFGVIGLKVGRKGPTRADETNMTGNEKKSTPLGRRSRN